MNIPKAVGWALIGGGIALNLERSPVAFLTLTGLAALAYVVYVMWPKKAASWTPVATEDEPTESEEPIHLPELGWSVAPMSDPATCHPEWRKPMGDAVPVALSADPPEAFQNLPDALQVMPERIREMQERAQKTIGRSVLLHGATRAEPGGGSGPSSR